MERFWELYRELGNSLDLDETLATFDRVLRPLIEYDAVCVHLAEAGRLRCAYVAGHGFLEIAALEVPRELPEAGLNSMLQARLEVAGKPIGVLSAYYTARREFVMADVAALQAAASKLAIAIENARRFQRANAAGRRVLFERLDSEIARIRRSHGSLAVLECAAPGLEAGGARSEQAAADLRRACREYDFIAQSADTLIVVLVDLKASAIAEARARIAGILRKAGLIPRIGAAIFPVDGYDAEDLLAAAHGAAHA